MHVRARGLRVGPPRTTEIRLDGGPLVCLRTDDSVIFEIFGFGAYDVDLSFLGDVRAVLDAGANIGCATLFLAERFPGARFACVEPATDTFALLRHNLERNGIDAMPVHAALTAEPRRVALSHDALPHYRRTAEPADLPGGELVDGLTVGDILDRVGFDAVELLKLDIEGGEGAVLERAADWAQRVRCIVVEVHDPLTPAQAKARLAAAGFVDRPLPAAPIFENVVLMERPA